MTASADKARYYLEQSIPELRELERKKIFSKTEISNIVKKRSDFEHKLNARGARPADFARYAEFEINLEALRKKRIKRLGIKTGQQHSNRRVFQVLDRATKKFHGDLGLWMQYLGVCRQQKAYNKINEVLSNVIRMHPTKPEVWIYAASYSMEEQGDMAEARSYLQRGLRFCRDSQDMWLTYARLEMLYISKIHARQEILGLNKKPQEKPTVEAGGEDDKDADMIALPTLTAEDLGVEISKDQQDDKDVENLVLTPALSGAIPIAIFDAAMRHFLDPDLAHQFWDMLMNFKSIPCLLKILDHVVEALNAEFSSSVSALELYIRRPTVNIQPNSAEFPQALAITFTRLKEVMSTSPPVELFTRLILWLVGTLDGPMHDDIEQALLAILLRVVKLAQSSGYFDAAEMVNLLEQVPKPNPNIISICFDVWPDNQMLKSFANARIGKEATALVQG